MEEFLLQKGLRGCRMRRRGNKMLGTTHRFIANIALACLDEDERHILYPRWGGIESGATLSDDFKIMWEPEEPKSKKKQLVHRCYINSKNPKDHGCVVRALDHSLGSISFIEDYQKGQLDSYGEDDFLENLGMFLGITCHHIGDLCTPVHVGQIDDPNEYGYKTTSRFHNRFECDIVKLTSSASLSFKAIKKISISREYFWNIAQDTYKTYFMELKNIYPFKQNNEEKLINIISGIISKSVYHTASIWHTVLKSTQMTDKKWSMKPLL